LPCNNVATLGFSSSQHPHFPFTDTFYYIPSNYFIIKIGQWEKGRIDFLNESIAEFLEATEAIQISPEVKFYSIKILSLTIQK
jgi:hypothetical protein